MNKLRARLSKKLKGKAGESLAEVLISLLIAALALTMLASVISSAARMITQSKKTMRDYYAANGELTTHVHGSANTASGTLTVTVKQGEGETAPVVKLISASESLGVTYFSNQVVSVRKAGVESSVVAFWLTPPTP